jgi:hypothetical protein
MAAEPSSLVRWLRGFRALIVQRCHRSSTLPITPAYQGENSQWHGERPIYPESVRHHPILLAGLFIKLKREETHAEDCLQLGCTSAADP